MYQLSETTIRIATITINVVIILLELYVFKSIKRKKMFLNESFTEETFGKIQSDVFNIHKINYALEDKGKYKMELY